jgi:8-oxo-dGTP pyrophosphatase MutT (NUDIX family)
MAVGDAQIRSVVADYLNRHPEEAEPLADPVRQLVEGADFASRHTYPMHVTVGALLVRGEEVLLVDHLAYGILLQPGGHLEPTDLTLIDAALRELVEEADVDPGQIVPASHAPVYVEYGPVPARPAKGEPAHFHLDIGYSFTAPAHVDVGRVQGTEVRGAAWYPLTTAERLVGQRVSQAIRGPADVG